MRKGKWEYFNLTSQMCVSESQRCKIDVNRDMLSTNIKF